MERLKLNNRGGNWETVIFIVIRRILVGNNPHFSRSELLAQEHVDFMVKFTGLLGHKENPEHP
jgi:hypothetical protein